MTSAILDDVIPFRFLSAQQRAGLGAELVPHDFKPGDVIIRQGEADDRVYVIESGSVAVFDLRGGSTAPLATITAGHYFGERAPLFGEARSLEVRAAEATRCLSLPGKTFLRLLAEAPAFAHALAHILRDKQGIFVAFDQFMAELLHGVADGEIDLRRLLPLYRKLAPALHRHVADDAIDFGALAYAVRRLPANITRTFLLFLTDNVPDAYAEPDRSFRFIPTGARPRAVYEIVPGKSMVLLRDGLSDLIDLVTCLCALAVEARKLRKRIADLSPDELEQLREVWPEDASDRLRELAAHHEDFHIEIRKQLNNYNSAHSERWTAQLARATRALMGHDPNALPDDVTVHVISSNTHSVINCLSPFLAAHAGDIRAWAERTGHRHLGPGWHEPADLAYALSREWQTAHPEAVAQRREIEHACGFQHLRESAFTGIEVQLIDMARVGSRIDPSVTPPPSGRRSLLVNIDFAFGQQAEEIIGNLIVLFGRNLASVNILGKAGALQGRRGDILVPTCFIEQQHDQLHPVSAETINLERLRGRAHDRGVHVGPMLTVAGTLLQNHPMLQFYRHIWRCIGLEMEGYFYHRKLEESAQLGVVPPTIPLRFLYYVSDLPLDSESNLSGRMSAVEGVPPLYAVTREILSSIFEQEARR